MMDAMSTSSAFSNLAGLPELLLRQPADALYPAMDQYSAGFGEAGWREALRVSNECLIPQPLTLSVRAGAIPDDGSFLPSALAGLGLHARELADDREVVAVVLHPCAVERLGPDGVARMLDAIAQSLRTVAHPQVDVRLDAASQLDPARLHAAGATRLTVVDRAAAPGPQLLHAAQSAGFASCAYLLQVPQDSDAGFLPRLRDVLSQAPERVVLPAPHGTSLHARGDRWAGAWEFVCAAGYRPAGADHYLRGDLEPPAQRGNGERHCDLAGVPRRDRSDFIGMGPGARSQIGDVLLCMDDDIDHWRRTVASGHPAVSRGIILSVQERQLEEVVQCIACDHAVDMATFEWRNAVSFQERFAEALPALQPLLRRGWLKREGDVLRLQGAGCLLWRMMAQCFRSVASTC